MMNFNHYGNILGAIVIGVVVAVAFTSIGQTIIQKSVLDFLLPITVIGYFLLDLKLNSATQE